jgi:hypothetical protein
MNKNEIEEVEAENLTQGLRASSFTHLTAMPDLPPRPPGKGLRVTAARRRLVSSDPPKGATELTSPPPTARSDALGL